MNYLRIKENLLVENWLPVIILEDYSVRIEYKKGIHSNYEEFTREREWLPIPEENKELIEQAYTIDWEIELSSDKSKLKKISLLKEYYL